MTDDAALWRAFQAGFATSAEGFNAEVMAYQSFEDLRRSFERWVETDGREIVSPLDGEPREADYEDVRP